MTTSKYGPVNNKIFVSFTIQRTLSIMQFFNIFIISIQVFTYIMGSYMFLCVYDSNGNLRLNRRAMSTFFKYT